MEISEVKKSFLTNVMYDGSEYRLLSCVLWLDKKERRYRYSCELQDVKSKSSVIRVPMERVETNERTGETAGIRTPESGD